MEENDSCFGCTKENINPPVCKNNHKEFCKECWSKWARRCLQTGDQISCPMCKCDCNNLFPPYPKLSPHTFDPTCGCHTRSEIYGIYLEFKDHILFEKTILYTCPELANQVHPDEFDLARPYLCRDINNPNGDVFYIPLNSCPVKTLQIWRDMNVKFTNLHRWFLNRENEPEKYIEEFIDYIDKPEYLYEDFMNWDFPFNGKQPRWMTKILEAAVNAFSREHLIEVMPMPTFMYRHIPITPPISTYEIIEHIVEMEDIYELLHLHNNVDLEPYTSQIKELMEMNLNMPKVRAMYREYFVVDWD